MIDLAPILPKLDKLVRMLSNENDHEALTAVRVLGKTLKGAGASFHDLAEAISAESAEEDDVEERRPRRKTWSPPGRYSRHEEQRDPPQPAGPPLWETMEKAARFAWLEVIIVREALPSQHRALAGELRAQYFSQPHKQFTPRQAAALNAVFCDAWLKDIRPLGDLQPGDKRQPLRWTGLNRDDVARVLSRAVEILPYQDRAFAQSVVSRIRNNPEAFTMPSLHEIERIERLLVMAYDLGARP